MTYIALLRGINVGGNSTVKMSVLKTVFERLGYTGVTTYINSGNIIFQTESRNITMLTDQINEAIAKKFGYPLKTLILEAGHFMKICDGVDPTWLNDKSQKTDILFLWEEFNKKEVLNLIKLNTLVDNVLYVPGAIIWNVRRQDYSKSGMNNFIKNPIYKHTTARNCNTVRKLKSLIENSANISN